MADDSPPIEEVVNALPERAIDVGELFRLTIGSAGEFVFIPSSTYDVEGGVRIATIAVQHPATDHRYLVGWDPEAGRWIGINDWRYDEFQPFELEYDVVDWLEEKF
jgi:hypothetical protein